MKNEWNFKQAKLIYALKIKGYEPLYELEALQEINMIIKNIELLPDFIKREIKLDTILE